MSGMARLPNSQQAFLDLRKLEDYCLDPVHPPGRHKGGRFATRSVSRVPMPLGCETHCCKP